MNLLILSGVASAINYIESLKDAPDIKLFVSDCDPYCPGLYVQGVTPVLLPRARDTNPYRAALAKAIETYAIDALIPTSDYDVEAVLLWLKEGWQPKLRLFRPSFDAFSILGSKDALIAHLAPLFPEAFPHTFPLDADPETLPYPIVVKPRNMSGGKGVSLPENAAAFRAARERLVAAYGKDLIVQEFIPGSTYVLTLVYNHAGKPAASVGMRSHLTFFTWGGGGCAGELVDEPDLIALGQVLIEKAGGWRGPINLEFRRHAANGRFYLMEANCRLNGYGYLTTMNGIDLPRLAVDLLRGKSSAAPRLPDPQDRRNFIIGYRETPVESFLFEREE
jgi:hypothetical protein